MADDHKILKGIGKGLGQLGMETVEKLGEEGERVFESTITGKQLLGLDNTMSGSELEFKRHEDAQKSSEEIKKIRGEMGQDGGQGREKKPTEKGRNVEEEIKELQDKKKREEEDKEKYYEEQKRKQEQERQRQEEEYNESLMMESSNPAKQKKSRGSAFIQGKKKKSQPTQSQMSQTSEFKGKID